MAGVKIIDLPSAPSAQLTDVFPVSQGGVTYKELNSQLLSLFESNIVITPSNFSGTLPVGNGGTGNTTFTPFSVICAGTTATGAFQNVVGLGNAGEQLTSNGAGLLPTWQTASGGVTSITGTANQIIASAATGAVTLSTPQDIATSSSPTFAAVKLTGGAFLTTVNTDPLIAQSQAVTIPDVGGSTGLFIMSDSASNQAIAGDLEISDGLLLIGKSDNSGQANSLLTITSQTASRGSLNLEMADNVGNFATIIKNATQGQSSTYTIVDAGNANARFLIGATAAPFVNGNFPMNSGTGGLMVDSGIPVSSIGTVTSVSGTTNRITSTGGTTPVIDISASYVGQASITTVGTITSGTWNGTTIAVANGGTGITSLGTGVATWLGTPSSANLATAVTDETGSGALVFATSPTLVTPLLGTPASGVLTNTTGGGGLRSFQVFTSGTAATYTKPANVTSILVEVIGGGGAGGGAAAAASSVAIGGCGGGGGYARLFVAAAAGTYTYTVGAGGTAGTAGNNPGNAGGTTTFSASSLQATGGAGGTGAPANLTSGGGSIPGGAGGVGTNGNVNISGENGGWGFNVIGLLLPGKGGGTVYGSGGQNSSQSAGNGTAGNVYGGGGSGGQAGAATDRQGGAGADGLIVVWEFA